MAIGKKIRIYDLARELKQDAKRVLEDLRREGADVSVPSNSVSVELAEKVRQRYFPKIEVAPKRGIKVIKATRKDETEAPAEAEIPTEPSPDPIEVPQVAAPVETPPPEEDVAPQAPAVRKLL